MPADDTSQEQAPSPSRRRLLDYVLNGGTLALVGATVYPVLRFVIPPPISEAVTNSVVAAQVGDLTPNSGKIFRFGRQPGLLVMTEAGQYRAYSAVCSHLQCTVQYRADRSQIWCACHNGLFDLNGQVVSGPPPKGLDEYRVDVQGSDIVVSRV